MKKMIALCLFWGVPALALEAPKNLTCLQAVTTVSCAPREPTPCPMPPAPGPRVFVSVPLTISSGSPQVSGRASIAKDIDVNGKDFNVGASGAYEMNADGSHYSSSVQMSVTDKDTGWTTVLPMGQASVRINLDHVTPPDADGRVVKTIGFLECALD